MYYACWYVNVILDIVQMVMETVKNL